MLYFVDESGVDLCKAPCEVLTAISISEEYLREFIEKTIELKRNILAMNTLHEWEPKGTTLLKRKKFRLANQLPPIAQNERYNLLRSLYRKNKEDINPTEEELTAIGQASLDYASKLLELCSDLNINVFSAVVPKDAIQTTGSELRKDYSYLFQRIYYHLTSISESEKGIIVFDEVDKATAKRLIKQMRRYFLFTHSGIERSKRIIPEPFFVHSDLTTATQLADIIAYIINWGYRFFARETIANEPSLPVRPTKYRTNEPVREELVPFAEKIFELQFHIVEKDYKNKDRVHYSIVYITDLKTRY